MTRLPLTRIHSNVVKARFLFFDHLSKDTGKPSNMARSLANSEPVLESYLFMEESLAQSTLSPRLRVQLALLVAQTNTARYCLAQHTDRARKLGLSESEISNARQAHANNIKECTALKFASGVLAYQGIVSDFEFDTLREVGFTDREITEIIAHISFNVFTNYFTNLAQPASDYPPVELNQRPVTRLL